MDDYSLQREGVHFANSNQYICPYNLIHLIFSRSHADLSYFAKGVSYFVEYINCGVLLINYDPMNR